MDRKPPNSTNSSQLEGWKAIAHYFRRDVRTVQRWERTEGLPVHRHNHSKQATASAFVGELEEWRKTRGRSLTVDDDDQLASTGARSEGINGSSKQNWHWTFAIAISILLGTLLISAVKYRSAAARVTTTNPRALAALNEGERLYAAGRYPDSVEPLERATAEDPAFALAWATLAKAYARASQPSNLGTVTGNLAKRATEAADQALTLAPSSASSHIAAAYAERANRRVVPWRGEAQRAISIDPRAAEAYLVLADSYSALIQYGCERDQNPELAEAYYAKALSLDPSLPPNERATNLRYLGRYRECITLLSEALLKTPSPPVRLEQRGRCRLMEGDIAGAAEDIEPLRNNRRTGRANAFIDLGWLALRRGDSVEGVRALEQAADAGPNALNELTIAYAYGDAGDQPHAVAHLERAFALNAACPKMVRESIAFERLRSFPGVHTLISEGQR